MELWNPVNVKLQPYLCAAHPEIDTATATVFYADLVVETRVQVSCCECITQKCILHHSYFYRQIIERISRNVQDVPQTIAAYHEVGNRLLDNVSPCYEYIGLL